MKNPAERISACKVQVVAECMHERTPCDSAAVRADGGGCVYRILLNTQGVPQDAFVHWGSVLRRVRHEQFRGSAVAVVSTPAAR